MAAYILPEEFNTRYVLGERLGKGGMADVFKVTFVATGVLYACKFSSYSSKDHMVKMQRESDIHLKIRHPHIIRMWEAVNDKPSHRFVMILDLAPNGDLSAYMGGHITAKTFIDERTLWCHLAQLVRGLHHLHCPSAEAMASGKVPVAHRDLKPDNILVDGSTLLLADLGCRKNMPDNDHKGTRLGRYLSPEMIRGQEYGLPTDIFSLGCLFFCEANFTHPFPDWMIGNGFLSVAYQLPTFTTAARVSPKMKQVILQMLQINPGDRPTTTELLNVYEIKVAGEDYDRDIRDLAFATAKSKFEAKMITDTGVLRRGEAALKRAEAAFARKVLQHNQATLDLSGGTPSDRVTRSMKRTIIPTEAPKPSTPKKAKKAAPAAKAKVTEVEAVIEPKVAKVGEEAKQNAASGYVPTFIGDKSPDLS